MSETVRREVCRVLCESAFRQAFICVRFMQLFLALPKQVRSMIKRFIKVYSANQAMFR